MTKAELKRVREFRHSYPGLCRGKTDEVILLHAKFVEAVRNEIRKERSRVRETGKTCKQDVARHYGLDAKGKALWRAINARCK